MMAFTNNNSSPWIQPESTHPQTGLVINNTLTKSKVPFIPRNGNNVSWYGCGPTVYDASHLGHARNYVTFDIIRRIMEDYLNYDVNMVMNITDIDDKIILRARQALLFSQYRQKATSLTQQIVDDVSLAFRSFVASKLKEPISTENDWAAIVEKTSSGTDPKRIEADEKFPMNYKAASTTFAAISLAREQIASGKASQAEAESLINAAEDVLALWLDGQYGAEVTDRQIFRDLAAYWEKDFFADMDALNVRRPNVLTRVSEFVPEIVKFVERIIENGYAYEQDGSVYFDIDAFDGKNGNFYAKLEPKLKGNLKLQAEGEGALVAKTANKHNPADFALWKKSKPGEPRWDSPWGEGRPGWHIECSVMASEILGSNIDLHTGGIDLTFPHHDNEIAQSEACLGCSQWINYFMHAGHFHVGGMKMSKSLKNFTTIKEALKKHSARQLRILFLLSKWDSRLDYLPGTMDGPLAMEKTFDNFFANTNALLRDFRLRQQESDGQRHFLEPELELQAALVDTKAQVHSALLDSFDTPKAMKALYDIVTRTNTYLQRGRASIDPQIVEMVGLYVTKIFRSFGLVIDGVGSQIGWGSSLADGGVEGAVDRESILIPVATVLSDFRDAVREIALSGGDKKALLDLCDRVRDQDLPDLGIVIGDHGDGRALIKFVNPEEVRREREARQAEEDAKRAKKEASIRAAEEKRLAKLAAGKLAPKDMFRTPEMRELYSEWNENGLPTKDKAGEELAKSKVKKLEKQWAAQEKLHSEYLKSQNHYLQYSNIAARALRRVVKPQLQAEVAKRETVAIKYAKWDNGKAGVSTAVPIVETRAKVEN
ncbi:cysteinyl-tRNA synthetase [Coemansia sp. RSA 2607]|nr:cysteinyl-tRNA synthetase [Coemansia sp. RSA 2607]KAJ2396637.1 cysteinyl-tRNA synthetase [Coemansia sp. RSA 2603]